MSEMYYIHILDYYNMHLDGYSDIHLFFLILNIQIYFGFHLLLMEAEEQAILGVMAWTRHLAAAADERAMTEDDPERRENLVEMARVCCKVAEAKPETFREVVQWIAPHYYQIGGPSADGKDQTSRMSYIILEAANKLKSSCNQTIRVWDGMDR